MWSAPLGMSAPVKMRTASPGLSRPAKGVPARDSPMTFRSAPDLHVGEADGVAIHGRDVGGRLGDLGDHGFGEAAAFGVGERARSRPP